ncbi:MAG: hypothetical protein KGI37_04540 [Alphaproteobacteria bacterium]|nr:hypothetical protein [Alphaproteobacteria bacterium]
MIDWRAHRLWLGIMIAALTLAAVNAPLLHYAKNKAAAHLSAVTKENTKAMQAVAQLKSDIALTKKLQSEIDKAETAKFLAPIDRLQAMKILEHRAAESRLSNVTYTLSPETKTPIETIGAGVQDFTTSQLTLNADAPTDLDAYTFLNLMHTAFPGRFTLRHMSITRIVSPDAPAAATNIHLAINGVWLSNGAPKNLVGGAAP